MEIVPGHDGALVHESASTVGSGDTHRFSVQEAEDHAIDGLAPEPPDVNGASPLLRDFSRPPGTFSESVYWFAGKLTRSWQSRRVPRGTSFALDT